MYDTSENLNHLIVINPLMNNNSVGYDAPVKNVGKIEVELGGFANQEGHSNGRKEWALERIMATGKNAAGNAWLRRDGGKVYGSVVFAENYGPVVTGANGKLYMLTVSSDGTLTAVEVQETEEDAPEVAVLIPTMSAGASWYNAESAEMAQSEITSVSFDAAYEPTGTEDASWACDVDGDGKIMA